MTKKTSFGNISPSLDILQEIKTHPALNKLDPVSRRLVEEWALIVEACCSDIKEKNGRLTQMDATGKESAIPQIDMLKKASSELRQIIKQLNSETDEQERAHEQRAEVLSIASKRAQARRTAAAT